MLLHCIPDFAPVTKCREPGRSASLQQLFKVLLRDCMCVSVCRSYLDNDSSLTEKETVMLVEEVVLLIAFAVTEIKRLIFIDSIIDSIKV